MATVVMAQSDLDRLMAERAALGHDGLDEMWEGTLHLVNAPKVVHARLQARLLAELYPHALASGLSIATEVAIFGEDPATSWRIPDLVVFDHSVASEDGIVGAAALAIEVHTRPATTASPRIDFYAARGVGQVLIIDPVGESVLFNSLGETEPASIPSLGVTLGSRLTIGRP